MKNCSECGTYQASWPGWLFAAASAISFLSGDYLNAGLFLIGAGMYFAVY